MREGERREMREGEVRKEGATKGGMGGEEGRGEMEGKESNERMAEYGRGN